MCEMTIGTLRKLMPDIFLAEALSQTQRISDRDGFDQNFDGNNCIVYNIRLFNYPIETLSTQMEQLDDDIIQAGIDAHREAEILVNHAISAATTHEKDKIIAELHEVWKVHEEAAGLLNGCIDHMSTSLVKLEETDHRINSNYQTLSINTGFIYLLDQQRSHKSKAVFIRDIKDIEAQISQIAQVSNNHLLQDAMTIPDDQDEHNLKLRDLYFKRLEELAYNLKKRSFVVDDSEDASLSISAEFGSVNDLLEAEKHLMVENELLKAEEARFLTDTIVKRRDLSIIDPTLLAKLGIALQHELQMQRQLGIEMITPPQIDDIFPPFDDIASADAQGEITYGKSEFSTFISPELVTAVMEATSNEEKLSLLREIMIQQEETINKLEDELIPLRAKRYSKEDEGVSREEKLWSVQDKFSHQITELQRHIDETNDQAAGVYADIHHNISERLLIGQRVGRGLHLFKHLTENELYLEQISSLNAHVCTSLSRITFNIGMDMMQPASAQSHHAAELFQSAFAGLKTQEETSVKLHPVKPPPPRDEESQHHDFRRMSSIGIKGMFKKPKRAHTMEVSTDPIGLADTPHSETPEAATQQPHVNWSEVDILNFLSLAYDVSERTRFHDSISGKLQYALGTLRSTQSHALRDFEDDMRQWVESLQAAETIVLRKEKVDVETDVDTQPRTDGDAQTDDEQDPKKMKKGAAALAGKKAAAIKKPSGAKKSSRR